ncbi:glutathione S-transferase family protein [Legionella rowbothamii]|uniref:glutathione S-transferase family protein n=1 Tax=Legionella rowbothamii TaxID=96229 RepID=UPI001054EF3B|nr:glutathione S-transferase family protein [Legionella rowbothamii]
MIKLYQFPPQWSLPNPSPFCMKLETYLRMAKLPFEAIYVVNPTKGPKKKLPTINDEGTILGDSGLIISYLKEKYGDPLDSHISSEQKAQALAIQRLLEEHLYWIMVYSRWIDERYWPVTRDTFFSHLKWPLRIIIPIILQKKIRGDLYKHGIGRHSTTEIYQLGVEDLTVLSTFLKSSEFLLGNEPTSIDASAYAFLANILETPIASPLQDYAKTQPQFIDYCERMKHRFYL